MLRPNVNRWQRPGSTYLSAVIISGNPKLDHVRLLGNLLIDLLCDLILLVDVPIDTLYFAMTGDIGHGSDQRSASAASSCFRLDVEVFHVAVPSLSPSACVEEIRDETERLLCFSVHRDQAVVPRRSHKRLPGFSSGLGWQVLFKKSEIVIPHRQPIGMVAGANRSDRYFYRHCGRQNFRRESKDTESSKEFRSSKSI